jgi:hypothetical protein
MELRESPRKIARNKFSLIPLPVKGLPRRRKGPMKSDFVVEGLMIQCNLKTVGQHFGLFFSARRRRHSPPVVWQRDFCRKVTLRSFKKNLNRVMNGNGAICMVSALPLRTFHLSSCRYKHNLESSYSTRACVHSSCHVQKNSCLHVNASTMHLAIHRVAAFSNVSRKTLRFTSVPSRHTVPHTPAHVCYRYTPVTIDITITSSAPRLPLGEITKRGIA